MAQLLDMPSATCVQGVNSITFKPPPLNSFLSVPEVYDWHSVHSKDHPFFVYSDETTNKKVNILWGDVVQAIYRIANSVSTSLGTRRDATTRPLIGLYSSSDTLTYILGLVGVMRAGFPIFLISPRTSPVALQHLIVKSRVSHILMNADDKELKARLQSILEDPAIDVTVSFIPSWTQLFTAEYSVQAPPAGKYDLDSLSIVLHSSGSTALPELNLWTHKMVHTALWQPWYGERDICGQVMSTPSIPMAGASGVMQALFTASSGIIISGFQPLSPPVLPNPDNVWKSMIATESNYSFILQPFLGIWSKDPDKVKALAELEGVMFGGGPLPKEVGDGLAEKGVNIFTLFGSSEGGLLNTVFPRRMGLDWEWFSFYSLVDPGFRYEPAEETAELILKTCPTHTPTRTNQEFDNVRAHATSDLLQPHPTIPGLWKYVCRIADQETIGPGRKINAVALARILMGDPLIAGAVLVSATVGTSIAFGAIIEPVGSHIVHADLTDLAAMNVYKDLVWPTFERYNNIAPDPAKLTKEKVLITSPAKPFTYGEKGMPRRKEVIAMYHAEIQCLV